MGKKKTERAHKTIPGVTDFACSVFSAKTIGDIVRCYKAAPTTQGYHVFCAEVRTMPNADEKEYSYIVLENGEQFISTQADVQRAYNSHASAKRRKMMDIDAANNDLMLTVIVTAMAMFIRKLKVTTKCHACDVNDPAQKDHTCLWDWSVMVQLYFDDAVSTIDAKVIIPLYMYLEANQGILVGRIRYEEKFLDAIENKKGVLMKRLMGMNSFKLSEDDVIGREALAIFEAFNRCGFKEVLEIESKVSENLPESIPVQLTE